MVSRGCLFFNTATFDISSIFIVISSFSMQHLGSNRGSYSHYQPPHFIPHYYFTGHSFPKPGVHSAFCGSPTTYCLADSCLRNPFATNCYPACFPPGRYTCIPYLGPPKYGHRRSAFRGCCGVSGGIGGYI